MLDFMLVTMCCNLTTEPLLRLFVANVGLSRLNWKTVSCLGACSGKTSVTELAAGPSDGTRRDELTVRGWVRWRCAGQRVVDQGGDLKVHSLPNRKPVQLV